MPQQVVSGAYRILAIFAWVMVVALAVGMGLGKLEEAGHVEVAEAGHVLCIFWAFFGPAVLDRWLP